jgi:DNA-binding LacI/PurR family transcriptional regulator
MAPAPAVERARRPTIHAVAEAASVAISTVSYALNGSPRIATETRERVLAAAARLGYEPNEAARSLKRRRSGAIGLIVPDLINPFFATVAAAVEEEARSAGLVLVLCSSDARTEREAQYASLLRSQRLDGVIHLSGTGVPSAALVALAEIEPIVFVDERVPGMDAAFVGSDNRTGARDAARHVLACGHRRLGIIAGPSGLWTAAERLAGYREAFAEIGLDPASVQVAEGDYRIDSGYAAARQLLGGSRPTRPTALLVANDLMAIGACRYAQDARLRVPDDLGVVGYDDVPLAALVTPALTTVRQPAFEMGRCAARLLLDRIAGRQTEPLPALPAELVVRDSLAPIGATA